MVPVVVVSHCWHTITNRKNRVYVPNDEGGYNKNVAFDGGRCSARYNPDQLEEQVILLLTEVIPINTYKYLEYVLFKFTRIKAMIQQPEPRDTNKWKQHMIRHIQALQDPDSSII
jgi:hypothetical protein